MTFCQLDRYTAIGFTVQEGSVGMWAMAISKNAQTDPINNLILCVVLCGLHCLNVY